MVALYRFWIIHTLRLKDYWFIFPMLVWHYKDIIDRFRPAEVHLPQAALLLHLAARYEVSQQRDRYPREPSR